MSGLSELAILLVVAVVVFGAKKLPAPAPSAGKAARILKSERKAMKADGPAGQQSDAHVIQVRPGDRTGDRSGNETENGSGPVST